jgi:carbonic anhydrase
MRRRLIVLGLTAAAAAPGRAAADLCGAGRRQSPIDIGTTRRQALPPLRPAMHRTAVRVDNDGHTVRLRFAHGQVLALGRERLDLQQFHFHIPGGDRLHGEEFPLALHALHKRSAGGLVAVVVLFRMGAEHDGLATLLPQLPARGAAPRLAADIDPAAWLPAGAGYYAYDGSLTAPPCTEGVLWLVLKQQPTLSASQWAQLQTLFPHNARPVQPLNGRTVSESP